MTDSGSASSLSVTGLRVRPLGVGGWQLVAEGQVDAVHAQPGLSREQAERVGAGGDCEVLRWVQCHSWAVPKLNRCRR